MHRLGNPVFRPDITIGGTLQSQVGAHKTANTGSTTVQERMVDVWLCGEKAFGQLWKQKVIKYDVKQILVPSMDNLLIELHCTKYESGIGRVLKPDDIHINPYQQNAKLKKVQVPAALINRLVGLKFQQTEAERNFKKCESELGDHKSELWKYVGHSVQIPNEDV